MNGVTRIVLYKARDGWRWRLLAKNGKIIAASSEAFVSKRNAHDNAWRTYVGLADSLGD